MAEHNFYSPVVENIITTNPAATLAAAAEFPAASMMTPSAYPAQNLFTNLNRTTMELFCSAGSIEVRFFNPDLSYDPGHTSTPFEVVPNNRLVLVAGKKWIKDWGTQSLVPFMQIVGGAGIGGTFSLFIERN